MDEDLLFKTHNESKIPEINRNCQKTQKQTTFCQMFENGFLKEESSSFRKTFKHRQEKSIAKVLQNYDYKTNILSNVTLNKDISSPFLSNIIYYSFSSDCLFKIRRSNRCAIRNHKNENIFPTNKKMLILNDKCFSGFNSIMKNNPPDKIINRTLCDFKESCLTNRQSNLKRKLESDVINELNLRLDNTNKKSSKLITYRERFDRTLSHSKHFKSDDSSQIYENESERFVLQPKFMNRIDTIENYNFKQMKNIEIQSSPVKIRVAANFGEDSVEYIDPTMEVELDSDDSDPDEPGEQNVGAVEDPLQLNQTAEANNVDISEDDVNTSGVNVTNIVEEDNSNKSQSEHPDTSNEDADKNNSILNEQCLDKDAHNNIEANQSESDKDVFEDDYKESALEKRKETDSENIKDSVEAKGNSSCLNSLPNNMLTPDKEGKTGISDLNRIENDPITLDKISDDANNVKLSSEPGKHAMSVSGANQTEFFMKECCDQQHEELEVDSRKDKTVEVNKVEKQTEISANVEDTKLSTDENFEEEVEKSESETEKAENHVNEGQEKVSKDVDCMEVNGDDGATEETNEKENDRCSEQSKNLSEKEEEFLGEVVCEKINELVCEQESELHEDCINKEEEENTIEDKIQMDDAGTEEANVDTETLENLEDVLKNKHNENFQGNEKEEIECTNKMNGNTGGYENSVICKIEEDEKETAVDSEKSESITDEISENKDAEINEIQPDTANGGVKLKEVESCIEEKEIEENLQSHSETEDKEIDNLKVMNSDEDNSLEKQQSLENLTHPIVENEDDGIEKDSIEDGDNCLSATKQETESQDLCTNLEKYYFVGETPGVSANELKSVKDESVLAKENKSTEEFDKVENKGVQQPISSENTTKSGDVSEKSEENNNEKEELRPEGNEFPNSILETADIDEYITEKSNKNSVNDSKRADETDLALEKVDETSIHDASENEIFDSESADENISDNKKHAKIKEESVADMKEKLLDEEQNESTFLNTENFDCKNEEEIIQKSKEGENNNVIKSSLTGIVEDTTEQVMVTGNGKTTCEEETFISCKSTTQESTPKEGEGTVYQTITDQAMVRSSEKQKAEKPEQSSSDSAKVISPRKGIKVEEDEIETAISSIVFYDEMSDGSEQITQTVPSAAFSKPSAENENISCEIILTSEDAQKTIEEEAGEMPSSKVNEEEPPLQATAEDGDLASAEIKAQPSTSPKKRKKKRKISRSRSAKKDGTSSATKRSQDSKGSARTARSVSSTSARSPSAGEKKLPPIKAPVGATPPPNIKQVRSKIGSLDNVTHKPKGGDKKVESVKLEWNAKSKVGSLDYANHKPGGGDKKILTQKLQFKNVQSKVGSKDNLKHKPAGGNVKISTEKLDFKAKAASKVGSLDNAKHKPGGGNVAIKSEKLHFKERATPKLQSRSGSERGSSHGGSETQSPIMPSSPAPPEELPPLNEDENPSSQEEVKPENPQEKLECNGAGESTQDGERQHQKEQDQEQEQQQQQQQQQQPPSNDASQTQSEVANTANDANNDNNANDGEDAKEDQLIAF